MYKKDADAQSKDKHEQKIAPGVLHCTHDQLSGNSTYIQPVIFIFIIGEKQVISANFFGDESTVF